MRTMISRLLITLMVAMASVSSFAQDSYREALKEYLSLNGGLNQLKEAYKIINENLFEDNDNVVEQLTERYLKDVFVEDCADMVEPILKERNVTEADLRAVYAMMSTPEGQTFISLSEEWNAKFKNALKELMPSFEEDSVAKNEGKITVNPDIDAAYAVKFNHMLEASDIKQKMLELMDGFFPSHIYESNEELDELDETKDMFNNWKNWLDDNLTTVALNSAYGIFAPDDLDYGVNLFSNESYRKMTDMSGVNIFSIMGNVSGIMVKYIEWMESQGAQLSERAKGLKKLMNMDENWSNEGPITEGPEIR